MYLPLARLCLAAMGSGTAWTEDDAMRLQHLIDAGHSYAKIARLCGWSISSVKKAGGKLRKGIPLKRYRGRQRASTRRAGILRLSTSTRSERSRPRRVRSTTTSSARRVRRSTTSSARTMWPEAPLSPRFRDACSCRVKCQSSFDGLGPRKIAPVMCGF